MRIAMWATLVLVPCASAPAGQSVAPATESGARLAEFAQVVRPFVASHCLDCHDAATHKGDLNLETLVVGDAAALEKNRTQWETIYRKLRHGEMPPKDELRPDALQARAVSQWLTAEFDRQDRIAPVHVGRVAPRRLNRSEYDNTIRDLLGVNFQPADDFPPDDSGYGFDNNGDVLSLSPLLMEKYLKAAEQVARAPRCSASSP